MVSRVLVSHPLPCTCVKMEPFVLLAFFQVIVLVFTSKSDILPWKRSVFGAWKGAIWGSKRTHGEFRFPGRNAGKQGKILGQKSCRTKVPRIFRIFVPDFAPEFCPRIFRGFFVLRFVGNGDQKKFTKNPRHFSMPNSQANTKKIFTKCFWRAGQTRENLNGGSQMGA